ncbi:putative ABC transporter permease subunit [Virgibacillus alimentarius]|uniref:putative ABC transporter permease subunit n=1 Tax=Virgibacillus alimentarius TaxID=698769 RepID=UPI0004937861|nr:hypothetical protein [Virgibacillus alimentarius]
MMKPLLKNQWKIITNTLQTQSLKNYISYVIAFGFVAFFLFLICRGIWEISDAITQPVLFGILSYGFLMIIGFILLLGLPQVFKHLYSATDLNLLFTLPIPTQYIFWMKYFQSFIGIPFFTFVFCLIPLIMYGIVVEAHFLYYPVAFIVLLAFTIIGLSLAYLFNLILIQIIPASKANEFMTMMSVLSGLFVYLLLMLPNWMNNQSMNELLLSGLPLFPDWFPVNWGSEAIIHASHGSIHLLLPTLMLLLLTVICMVLSTSLVEKGFRTGWIRLNEGSSQKKKIKKRQTSHPLSHPVIAVGIKEWYAIKRDMREWLAFMPMLFFMIFPLIGFLNGDAKLNDIRVFNEVSWPIAQGAILFLHAILNGTLAASSIGREGSSAWILRVLPLPGKYIAIGKLWISWLTPFVLLTFFEIIVGVILGWTFFQFITGIVIKAVISIGISSIGLWLGTTGAKYNPENPQARLKFGTSIILMVLSYVYIFFALIPYVILIIPAETASIAAEVSHDISGFFGAIIGIVATLLAWKASSPFIVGILCIIVMLIISSGVAIIFTMVSARRMDRGIEIDFVNGTKAISGRRTPSKRLY